MKVSVRRLHAVALVGNRCDRIDPEWRACQRGRSEAVSARRAVDATFHPGGSDEFGRPDGARATATIADKRRPPRPGSAGIYRAHTSTASAAKHPFGDAGSRRGSGPDNPADSADSTCRSCPTSLANRRAATPAARRCWGGGIAVAHGQEIAPSSSIRINREPGRVIEITALLARPRQHQRPTVRHWRRRPPTPTPILLLTRSQPARVGHTLGCRTQRFLDQGLCEHI